MTRRLVKILATDALILSLFTVAAVPGSGHGHRRGSLHGQGQHYGLHAQGRSSPHCDTPDEISKYPPWPPFCT
jgi:hypothetical protein